ncbi:MAG: ABC transporter ATP-binding protein [Anaerolineaceae bacterium]|nr:ABC transporter ATP-binding protein [Anaerolineaceae bacterium]
MSVTTSTTEFSVGQNVSFDRRGPVRWVASHAWRNWPQAAMGILGALGNAAMAAVVPILVGQAYNLVMSSQPSIRDLLWIAVWIAVSQVLRGVFQFVRNFGFEWIAQRVERDVRNELYVNLLGKSMTFHSLQPVGDTMARATNDVREVNFLFSPGLNLVIGSLNFLFVPLFAAPSYHPSLILTPLLFVLSYIVALWRYLESLKPVTDEVRAAFGQLNTRLSEALDGVETVKGAAQEAAEVLRFGKNAQRYRNAAVLQGQMEARYLPLLLFNIALGVGLFHALVLFRQGILDGGQVIAYFGLLLLLDFPTFISLFAYSQISLGLAGARRILELMNRENNLDQNLAGFHPSMQGAIEFRNVSFHYGDNGHALSELSFRVQPGQTVAIVGQTGSGKTTLTKLVNRTYDATLGSVLVDGRDVRQWNLEALRRNISIIEQDIFLFSRSIAENIAFGCPGASQAEIEAAARSAQAHEFILSFADGYQTVIGERGVTLSGGQRQRLALARAFLTDPKILVLDDSTSAIDSATEDLIQRAILTASRGRTTLIITHRLSQIRWADLIIVMRKGRIAAMGGHQELMQTSPAYRQIFQD